jgi:transketolase
VPLEIIGVQDKFGESGAYEALLQKFGLDKASVATAAKKVIARK